MAYYLRVIRSLISDPIESIKDLKEAPTIMVFVTTVMTFLVILFGIYPEPVIHFARLSSEALISGLNSYIGAIFQ
jgi:NADH:ubiquinone oxidoreductase subunit 2 (subunit N)